MKNFIFFFVVFCISSIYLFAIDCSQDNCPTGYYAAGSVQITIGTCVYDVCYCWTRDGNTVHLWMDPVINIASGGSGCFPYTGSAYVVLMRAFGTYIIQNNPDNLDWPTCPPCTMNPPPPPPPNVYIVEYFSKCYNDGVPSELTNYGLCSATYSVCCNGGIRQITFVSSTNTYNGCTEDGYAPVCNP
jgi:hypothetical protein